MDQKKFISIIRGYHKQIFYFDKKQNYHMLPLEAMQEEGYKTEIFAIDSKVKIQDDPNFVQGTTVIYYTGLINYLFYLYKNKNEILYSNSLTIKTLLVGIFGKKTVFIPHDSIFGSNTIKKIIIVFFYFFYKRIRLNNDAEVSEVNKIKKRLGVKIPLVVSENFYRKKLVFSDENIIVSLGNLIPKKQPELLLKALKIVKEKGFNFKLKVIGEDRLSQYYTYSYNDLLIKYGLVNDVKVLGFIDHNTIPDEMNGACLYVNTSLQEGFCLAVYECSLLGLGVILPNILSFQNIFGNNALYYNNYSEQELANQIIIFLKNKTSYINKIKTNQEGILQKYNYGYIKDKLKHLFINL